MRAHYGSLLFLGLVAASDCIFPRLASADELTAANVAATASEQLFSELAAKVADLKRQGSILKRVVKLVRPTVVHIEAKRDSEPGRPVRDIDEAGSGVVVERNDRHYVLTNRHVIKY